jgi:uncharacterized protein YdaU (DUF1376 family)
MSSKPPAFQFYPQDYLASTRVAEMTLEEEGVYIRLLCYCWASGSIPADPERCAKLAGKGCSVATATVVQRSFNEHPTDPQRLVHDRLEIERENQRTRREQASSAGKKSAERRAKTHVEPVQTTETPAKTHDSNGRSTVVQRNLNPSSSSSDEDVCVSNSESQVVQFEDFWSICPRKTAKGSARKAWLKAIKTTSPETIVDGMKVYAKSTQGTEPQFIAHPATWLNAERWLDETTIQTKKPRLPDYKTPAGKAELEKMFLDGLHS